MDLRDTNKVSVRDHSGNGVDPREKCITGPELGTFSL